MIKSDPGFMGCLLLFIAFGFVVKFTHDIYTKNTGIPGKSSCSPEVLNRGWLACDNPDCCEEMRPALREVLTPEMTQRAIEAYMKNNEQTKI